MVSKRSDRNAISLGLTIASLFITVGIINSLAFESDTNRPGMDYSSVDLGDPNLCEQACNDDPVCLAWTYVKPGIQGPSGKCWLKNEIPDPSPDICCDSGIKGKTPAEAMPSNNEQIDSATSLKEQSDNKILLSNIPLNIHRRAAQQLEEVRGSTMAPGWENAILAETVIPFYRPDSDKIAYYEFKVEPKGFLILSATEDDFPISHWSSEDETISSQLENEAKNSGKSVGRFFKLDTLSYVAEDYNGEQVASLGDLPNKITVLDSTAFNGAKENNINIPPGTEAVAGKEIDGPTEQEPAPIEIQPWESWSELKKGYSENYAPFLEALSQDAAKEWKMVTGMETEGEGLVPGGTRNIALLYKNARYDLKGEGQNFASVNFIQRPGLPDILQVVANSIPPEGRAELEILIRYDDIGQQEIIRFAILDPEKVQPRDEFFKQMESAGAGSEKLEIKGDWGPWHFSWTGPLDGQTHEYQRLYRQLQASQVPANCPSECGATAWAMLLGWADHQAALNNPVWRNHWGIYRQNGGYGADADAPRLQDVGIDAITREIRGYIRTFCVGSNAPTLPGDMWRIIRYRDGRDGFGGQTSWDWLPRDYISRDAKQEIVWRRNPAIIGTGFLSHYPLAYGHIWCERINWHGGRDYAQRFFVNQGWGGSGNGWISDSTWFMGRLWI